jgi:hypothetical protein
MAGRVKVRRRPHEARSWAVQGGQTRRDLAAARPGLTDVGWERELTGGAHASARGERENAKDGRRELKMKTYSAEYAKGAHGPSEPTKGMTACGGGKPVR